MLMLASFYLHRSVGLGTHLSAMLLVCNVAGVHTDSLGKDFVCITLRSASLSRGSGLAHIASPRLPLCRHSGHTLALSPVKSWFQCGALQAL